MLSMIMFITEKYTHLSVFSLCDCKEHPSTPASHRKEIQTYLHQDESAQISGLLLALEREKVKAPSRGFCFINWRQPAVLCEMFLLNARFRLQHFCKVFERRCKNVAEILVKIVPSRQCSVKSIYSYEMVEKFLKTVTVLDQIQIRKLTCFLEMARFTISSNLNIQRNRHQCYEHFRTFQ